MARCIFFELSYQASADQVAQGFTIAYLLQRHRQQKRIEARVAERKALSAPDGVPSKSMPSMAGPPAPSKGVPVPRRVPGTYPFKARPYTPPTQHAIPFKALPNGVVPPRLRCPGVLYKSPSNNDFHQTTECEHIRNNGNVIRLSPCIHCCNV